MKGCKKMKKLVKKISAVAMAFALLGAGATFAGTDNAITVEAKPCQYHRADNVYANGRIRCSAGCYHTAYYCRCCNQFMFYK